MNRKSEPNKNQMAEKYMRNKKFTGTLLDKKEIETTGIETRKAYCGAGTNERDTHIQGEREEESGECRASTLSHIISRLMLKMASFVNEHNECWWHFLVYLFHCIKCSCKLNWHAANEQRINWNEDKDLLGATFFTTFFFVWPIFSLFLSFFSSSVC